MRQASTSFDSPYGPYTVSWKCDGSKITTTVTVPPNGEARVVLEGVDDTIGSGDYNYETSWTPDPNWPPKIFPGPQGAEFTSNFVP